MEEVEIYPFISTHFTSCPLNMCTTFPDDTLFGGMLNHRILLSLQETTTGIANPSSPPLLYRPETHHNRRC